MSQEYVWAVVSSNGIIGLIFFYLSVTGNWYLNMPQTYFFPRVQQQRDIYFQQDGAPAYYAHCVHNWLDINLARHQSTVLNSLKP